MSDRSAIEWTEATWNPVIGCTPVSPGCLNCYAARMARRLEAMGVRDYEPRRYDAKGADLTHLVGLQDEGDVIRRVAEVRGGRAVFTGEVRCLPDKLTGPMHWRKPRRIFVNSMSDLFHEAVPFEFIDRVFAVMALCPRHRFQQLTKRPERAAEYHASNPVDRIAALLYNARYEQRTDTAFERAIRDRLQRIDLESRQATRARSEAGWRLLHGGHNQPVQEGEGGVSNEGRLPIGGGDDRRPACGGGCAPAGMDALPRPHAAGPDDQSQERGQGRQPAMQSGGGHIQRAEASRDQGVGCTAPRRARIEAPQDDAERSRGYGDSATSGGRLDGKGDRGAVRNEAKGSVRDRQSQDVAAYLTWPLPNVWLGTSVENRAAADERIPHLLGCPAAVRFLSVEPLLGPLDLATMMYRGTDHAGVQWVIVGGESGPGARPCDVAWIRSIVRQCREADAPVFVKQLGSRPFQSPQCFGGTGYELPITDPKGSDPAEWPADLRVRQWPSGYKPTGDAPCQSK